MIQSASPMGSRSQVAVDAVLDLPDRLGQREGFLRRTLEDVVRQSLGALGTDARQAPESLGETVERRGNCPDDRYDSAPTGPDRPRRSLHGDTEHPGKAAMPIPPVSDVNDSCAAFMRQTRC